MPYTIHSFVDNGSARVLELDDDRVILRNSENGLLSDVSVREFICNKNAFREFGSPEQRLSLVLGGMRIESIRTGNVQVSISNGQISNVQDTWKPAAKVVPDLINEPSTRPSGVVPSRNRPLSE